MKIKVDINGSEYSANLSEPIDISIPLHPDGPRAWYVDPLSIEPVRTERFTGSIAEGGAVNFRNISFNPHGHGTHTESVGHIDKGVTSINTVLKNYFFLANLVTIEPEVCEVSDNKFQEKGDRIISKSQLTLIDLEDNCEALVIRTVPNEADKRSKNYSDTNPPYIAPEGLSYLRNSGIKHLLIDLPSVDREVDGGLLKAHHAFWFGERSDDSECTITEMVYIENAIKDGTYLLNLQTAPFENDATPSRPLLFKLSKHAH